MKKIISISGIDGAGKSTQIGFIKKKLLRENKKVFIFWSRIGYTSGFQFIKDILRLLFRNQLPKAGNTKKRKKALKNRIVSNLWIFLAIMDLFYYYVIFLRIKYYTGHNIILDRYLIDSEIDLNINFPSFNYERSILWKVLKLTAIKPNINLLLIISPEESIKRSKMKNE